MLFEGFTPEHRVQVLFERDAAPVMIMVRHIVSGAVMLDDVFDNALLASAGLRDAIGLTFAIELLDNWPLSPNSDLWDLNHSRPHPRMNVLHRADTFHSHESTPPENFELLMDERWSGYDEGEGHYLYQLRESGLLFTASSGVNVMADPCHFDRELRPISFIEWRKLVEDIHQYRENSLDMGIY